MIKSRQSFRVATGLTIARNSVLHVDLRKAEKMARHAARMAGRPAPVEVES